MVPGGGLSSDRTAWIACQAGFFLSVRVLSRLFRRLFLEYLVKAFDAGRLEFFSSLEWLRDPSSFLDYLAPLREAEWVVYAKRPFAGPDQVLDYVARYTHRVAISNNRLLDIADGKVTFRYKDYRHDAQQKTMTLQAEEFIRRFLLHVLPEGFQRIRYYGFLANRYRAQRLARCRDLLGMPSLSPRSYARDPNLAARPTQASNAYQGYLMMEKTALGSRFSRAAPAWPNQVTGAALPNSSAARKSEAQIAFPRHHHGSLRGPRSRKVPPALITSGYIDPSPGIQPTINIPRPPAGQRFSPGHF